MEELEITPETEEPTDKIIETIVINQENNNYKLEIIIEREIMILNLYEEGDINNKYYNNKMSLKEIKNKHQIFYIFKSCQDFLDYIKASYENKKLFIKKNNENFLIIMNIEYLFKQEKVEIQLREKKLKIEDVTNDLIKEISSLKNKIKLYEENINKINSDFENKINNQNIEINKLKEENNKLKEEIKELKTTKNSLNNHIPIYSQILRENEKEMIFTAIESRINKPIIYIKKLYQASINGGDPSDFHFKCDNKSNTLVFIQSKGNKRFGGFTSNFWESPSKELFKDDNKAFVFSLDKQKIYEYKNDKRAIKCNKNYGPCFGFGPLIGIYGNPLNEKTVNSYFNNSSYNVETNFLGNITDDYAIDYEVFQILFG